MPSRFATMKRNAPIDFEESERPVKMMRGDHTPAPVHDFAMIGAVAPVTAPSPSKEAVKRKYEALDALDGTTTASRTGCRGGKKSAKRPKRAILDASNEDATGGSTNSPSAGEGTAEVPATTEGDAGVTTSDDDAVKTEPDNDKGNNEATITSPSVAEGTAEVPAATKEDAVATASELAEALFDAFDGEDIAELSTSTEGDA